jgi:hypothetical protein
MKTLTYDYAIDAHRQECVYCINSCIFVNVVSHARQPCDNICP